MRNWILFLIFFCFQPAIGIAEQAEIPEAFCALSAVAPGIVQEIRYAGEDNFTGRPIEGYEAAEAYLTRAAAEALLLAQEALAQEGLCLKVYDAYRPVRAVGAIAAWAQDAEDTLMKAAYYPDIRKDQLFQTGYIASRSGHSRGSTVDVTLVDVEGLELDMGGSFDLFSPRSAHGAKGLTQAQSKNRQVLRTAMEAAGFRAYKKEWWHYTLKDEPFADTYFDFPVQAWVEDAQ